jgi:hypothetical protein
MLAGSYKLAPSSNRPCSTKGTRIQEENQTLASITFQNYFRLYEKLSGMTGTADTESFELNKIYGLEVVVIPAILVAMVIEPGIPACSMIWASRSCCLAFSTSCFMLALFSMLEINSEFSTKVGACTLLVLSGMNHEELTINYVVVLEDREMQALLAFICH